MRQPDGHDRSGEPRRREQLENRDQSHLDRNHHQAYEHDEKEIPSRKTHPGEGVSGHRRDRQLDDCRRNRDEDAVDDRGDDVFDTEDLVVARQGESAGRKERSPPSGVTHVLHGPERVDDQTHCWDQPDDHEDDDRQVQRNALKRAPPGLDSKSYTAWGRRLRPRRDDLAHRISSCCWNLRTLTTNNGTIARNRMTPTAAARPKCPPDVS